MQISQTIRTATGHSQFLLIVGFMLLLSTPVSAGGRIVVDPPVMAPVEATGVVTFSIIAEGIPEPGLGTFALDIEFIGDRVELIDGGIVSHTDTEDKVVCSARFADNNSLIAEPVTGGVKIQSNAGSMLRNSRANGSMLCVDNGPANGNRSSYLCGLYGDVEPQNGSGSLIDFVCVVGTEVPVGEALRIQPTLYSGLGESSVVYPYGSAMGVIDSFDGGVLFIPGAGNGQPDALDDQVETDEDSALHIPVLNNDSDPEQDSLHITEITEPANGSAILDGVGILYTPGPDYNGQDSFNYTISDGKGGADLATVTVTVTPVNDPPNAYDDSTRTPWDSTRSIAVLSNDVDIDGDPLQIIGVSDPESGSVSTDGETVSYTPVPGVLGTVTFAYIISDGNGDTASAGVSLTVTAVNQVPLAESDTANTTEDTNTTIDVLSNDSDPDGDTLTIAAVVPGSGGTTFTNGDRITYRPAVNFTGQDSFTYTISDERGGVASASVSVTVSPSNDPPEAVPDIAITDEDTGVWIRALTNDWDPDSTELAILSVTDGQHGGSILENDRIRYFPHDNYFGQDNFTYSMSDGDGAETTGTVSITIVGVNDMPNAGDDSASLNEDTQVVIDVLVNDEDVDGDSLRVATVTQGTNGSVDIEDNSIRYTPARDFNGTDSFTYSISDPGGLMDSAIVSLVIHPVDEGPSADGVRITFPEITREGNTDIRTQTCLTRPESGFTFLTIDNPRCIWVDTEVEFTGNATVCIDYREAVTPLPLDTVMIRCDDGHCVPLPTRVNYDTEAVCGDTPSLSMFVLGNALDSDGDGTQDFVDACPWTHEQAQQDSDGDRIGDACDRCPTVSDYTNICGGTGLELHSGFNLIGIPIDAGNPELSAFGLLRAIGDETLVSHIQQFNPTTGTFEKAYYEGDLLQGIDFQIKSGSGYQLFMKQPIKGLRELNKGYNLIGAPNTRGQIGVTAFLLLTSIGDETILSSIQRLNPASGRIESASYFNGRPVGVDFPINAKTGYILYRR